MLDDMMGKQLDGYQLLELLGSGTFGAVYKAKDLRRNDFVAIKVMQSFGKKDEIDLFLEEVSNLTRLRHPHIVPIRNGKIDRKTDIPYIAMEYAPNGTLRSRHKRGEQLPLTIVVQYVTQIADALQFAHNDHIIHRDIKPENVLIGPNNELWLSDFGISMSTATFLKAINNTVPVNAAGTPYYMAPEQFLGDLDKAIDQYALAIMAYEWLKGYPPFIISGAIDPITAFLTLCNLHTNMPVPPLHDKRSDIPSQVEAVIMKALAKKPEERYVSVREFAQALEAAASKPPVGTLLSILSLGKCFEMDDVGRFIEFPCFIHINWFPDGTRLASIAGDRQRVRIWDVQSGQEVMKPTNHVDKGVWSPDGTRLAFGDQKTVQIWDVQSNQEVKCFMGHEDYVSKVAWSPDGTRIASASTDGTVRIWQAV